MIEKFHFYATCGTHPTSHHDENDKYFFERKTHFRPGKNPGKINR